MRGWVIAVVVLALVFGGGYYAWKTWGPGLQKASEAPYEETASSEPYDTSTLPRDGDAFPEPAPVEEPAPPAKLKQKAKAPPRPTTITEADIPEEIVGISPVDLTTTTTTTDEIVVPAPRRPVWTRTPNRRGLTNIYPSRALERRRDGEASLRCTVLQGGALQCERLSETPEHYGFGTAAMRVARMYRHGPQRADGTDAVGTPLNMRVVFRMAEGERRR